MNRVRTMKGQMPAKLATGIDLAHDELGVTNPNLHRRIDLGDPPDGEIEPRSYSLGIYGSHSYRTTTIVLHDEDSEEFEVP